MNDLFGQPVLERELPALKQRRETKANGYAKPPGSGPAGQFCRTCEHACKTGMNRKHYWKCGLVRRCWTHGPGTDIKLKSPACSMWSCGDGQ